MEKRNPGGSVFCKHALPVRTKIQWAYEWDAGRAIYLAHLKFFHVQICEFLDALDYLRLESQAEWMTFFK